MAKKINYSGNLKRSSKSNPHSNETYYSRLKEANGTMKNYEIKEYGHYWKVKTKGDKC
jgi:hypothetical protein